MVVASDTHSSPNTDQTKIGFSRVDGEYIAWAESLIAQRVSRMVRGDRWKAATLRFATTTPCDSAMHRRRRIWQVSRRSIHRAMGLYPNLGGMRDTDLRLMVVLDEGAHVLATVWGISCHPTDWPNTDEISSDFPGGVRIALREAASAKMPVLFFQGFAGTLRPNSVGILPRTGMWRERLLTFIHILLNGPAFVGFTPRTYSRWLNKIADCAREGFRAALAGSPCVARLCTRRSSIRLGDLGISGAMDQMTYSTVELGPKWIVVGISAEVSWEYAAPVAQRFAGKEVWPVGYIDWTFGYLPTSSMVKEGGYEVNGFMHNFGVSGSWAENLDDVVLSGLPGTTSSLQST